jgi:hypothetical protein
MTIALVIDRTRSRLLDLERTHRRNPVQIRIVVDLPSNVSGASNASAYPCMPLYSKRVMSKQELEQDINEEG